ncbi:hypothetical protein DVH24_041973 [Malus domestica]|uniref:Uncharacterized protein n=1 Tax=Malus domestica TaxID=3750 RepID=A0A498ISS2_MALDO|nr:hypothetical protein DVH24_041973 [Malus domestica]
MGYKIQVVASAIASPIHRKNEKGGRSILVFIGFYGLTPPHMVRGVRDFKMVVVASKNSTEVGRNRRKKMGCREGQLGLELGWSFWAFLGQFPPMETS